MTAGAGATVGVLLWICGEPRMVGLNQAEGSADPIRSVMNTLFGSSR